MLTDNGVVGRQARILMCTWRVREGVPDGWRTAVHGRRALDLVRRRGCSSTTQHQHDRQQVRGQRETTGEQGAQAAGRPERSTDCPHAETVLWNLLPPPSSSSAVYAAPLSPCPGPASRTCTPCEVLGERCRRGHHERGTGEEGQRTSEHSHPVHTSAYATTLSSSPAAARGLRSTYLMLNRREEQAL